MQINEQVLKILAEFNIRRDNGICYLISLFHGYQPDYIPEKLKQKINVSKIVEMDRDGTIKWNIPLYDGQETKFQWVKTEYVPLFKARNSSKGGKVRESTARMKKLFANNPDIRKEDVLGATKMYLINTNPEYIRFPHYFIEKGKGVEKTNDILDWIEKYKLTESSTANHIGNIMQ